MPKFITIGYGDEAGYQRTAPDIVNAAHAHDDVLQQNGAVMALRVRLFRCGTLTQGASKQNGAPS